MVACRIQEAPKPGGAPRFEIVFATQFSYVCRTLRRLGVEERDLDDVVQEVFVAVHRRFSGYDPSRPLRPWLFSFAVRTAANYRRLVKHRRERPAPPHEPPADGPSPEDRVAREQARALVHEALGKLAFDRRVVVVMHDIDELSVPQIAEVLSIKENTVYSRLRRGRRDFERAVRRRLAQGGGR